jgi:hypothetical protein
MLQHPECTYILLPFYCLFYERTERPHGPYTEARTKRHSPLLPRMKFWFHTLHSQQRSLFIYTHTLHYCCTRRAWCRDVSCVACRKPHSTPHAHLLCIAILLRVGKSHLVGTWSEKEEFVPVQNLERFLLRVQIKMAPVSHQYFILYPT